MIRFSGLPIRTQLLALAILLTLPALGIIVYSGYKARAEDYRHAAIESQKLADNLAVAQEQLTQRAQELGSLLAELPEVQSRNFEKVHAILGGIQKRNPQYQNILIADATGLVWVSAIHSGVRHSVADRRYFLNARSTLRFSSGEFTFSKVQQKPTIAMAYPLTSNNRFAGVVILSFDLDVLHSTLERSQLPKDTNYVLADHKGIIVSRGKNEAAIIGNPLLPSAMKQMDEGPERDTFEFVRVDGDKRVATYRKLRLAGEHKPYLYVRASISTRTAVARANRQMLNNLAMLTPFVIVAFALAFTIGKRSIADRVSHLQAAARQIADGDLDTRVAHLVVGGELGELGRAFDDMAHRLTDNITERQQAADEFRTIIQTTLDGFNVVDSDGRFLEANNSFCSMLGYSRDELLHMAIADIEAAEPSEVVAAHIRKIMEQGSDRFEASHRCKDGRVVDVEVSVTYRPERGGRFYGFVRDVSERKRVNEQLRQSEQRFRSFVENANDIVFSLTPAGIFSYVSPNWTEAFGYAIDETVGQPFPPFVHPDDVAGCYAFLKLVLETGEKQSGVEYRVHHKNGNWLWYKANGSLIREENGEISFVGIGRDITELKRSEDEIQRLNADLERRVALRTEELELNIREQESFSYTVSHDLRAPLRHINSYSAILVEEYGPHIPPKGQHYLTRIRAASKRMGLLIDDLLQLALVSRLELKRETVDLNNMAAEIVAMLRETEAGRAVEFHVAEGLVVKGDKTLLRMAMQNLLDNAWKYTGKVTTARIELGKMDTQEGPAFFVMDNGTGFDMQYVHKLFGPFQRLHGDDYEGTGIGLATVQRIIHRHKGRVWAEGRLNGGATFYFTLPQEL